MRAQGASEHDRRDRGNYSVGSAVKIEEILVMNSVYDYATGLGPLASNSLDRLNTRDLKRMVYTNLPPGDRCNRVYMWRGGREEQSPW
jgi:hypothetical protein